MWAKPGELGEGAAVCWAALGVFAFGFALLAVNLKRLQVDGAAEYDWRQQRQSVRLVRTAGVRGQIFDRNGVLLAGNRRKVELRLLPEEFAVRGGREAMVRAVLAASERVAVAVGRPLSLDAAAVRRHLERTPSQPLTVWAALSPDEVARFCERAGEFPGFACEETEVREYPYGELAAHVLGYVGRDRPQGAATGEERPDFVEPEMRGRSGLERYYDDFLRGVSGLKKVQVDATGFASAERTVLEPGRGPDLNLTLDARIQRAAERELRGLKGACVVLDAETGGVLAMASSPAFDLNSFVPILPQQLYTQLAEDPDQPLLNRAANGLYAPGSTFKPITALAALAAGVSGERPYECTGSFAVGGWRLHCSRRWGHGSLALKDALRLSCNPYFCHLALEAGTNRLISTARAFGLGAPTGLDLGEDAAGVVPDAEWKERRRGERWYPGDTAQLAVGQSMLLVTPLQMAVVAAALGTGELVTPHFKRGAPAGKRPLPFAAAALAKVRSGLRAVVGDGTSDSEGTGWRAGEGVGVSVAGKTGTAEVGSRENRRKNTWFIAYAPAERPQVAVALVVERGESGGKTAAPKVAAVLKEWVAAR